MKVGIKLRIAFIHLATNVGDDLFDRPAAIGFEHHGDVAVVGFGYGGEPKLQAGAPRCACHFGDGVDDLFDAFEHTICVGERCAGGHEVIEDEAAFVHGGQQIAAECAIAEEGDGNQREANYKQDKGPGKAQPE